MSDQKCYEKAKEKGEPTFTLRAQDATSPYVICDWIKANISTCPAEKLKEALDAAIEMRDWPDKKLAD
jgi:hypothetical protein